MSVINSISEKLKEYSSTIGSIFAIIASIGGGILYVEHNYANAGDVKELVKNQNSQIELLKRSQTQNSLFQLEYYDNYIKRLEMDRNRSEQLLNDPKTSNSQRAYTRSPGDIQKEIDDLNTRREIVKRSLIESK